eukprot:SAG11_NODE_640_length_8012_cov_14.412486_10_plen_130_part_00
MWLEDATIASRAPPPPPCHEPRWCADHRDEDCDTNAFVRKECVCLCAAVVAIAESRSQQLQHEEGQEESGLSIDHAALLDLDECWEIDALERGKTLRRRLEAQLADVAALDEFLSELHLLRIRGSQFGV